MVKFYKNQKPSKRVHLWNKIDRFFKKYDDSVPDNFL